MKINEDRPMSMERATLGKEKGFALLASPIILVLVTGVVMGFVANIRAEGLILGNDVIYSSPFYAAEAGIEKQNVDLSKLFLRTIFPSDAQISVIESIPSRTNSISYSRLTGSPRCPTAPSNRCGSFCGIQTSR